MLFGAISADKSISGGGSGQKLRSATATYAKCEAGGKEATATLSVLNLGKLEGACRKPLTPWPGI